MEPSRRHLFGLLAGAAIAPLIQWGPKNWTGAAIAAIGRLPALPVSEIAALRAAEDALRLEGMSQKIATTSLLAFRSVSPVFSAHYAT